MVICPVCETQQPPSAECVTCGKSLMLVAQVDMPVLPVDGLESSGVASTGDLPILPLDELDERVSVGAVQVQAVPDVELAHAPVGAVATERLDMTEDRVVDTSRTPVNEGPATCRWCGNVQAEGAQCDRCGMRLERVVEAFIMGVAEDAPGRCRACGVLGIQGQPCRDCGAPVPVEGA